MKVLETSRVSALQSQAMCQNHPINHKQQHIACELRDNHGYIKDRLAVDCALYLRRQGHDLVWQAVPLGVHLVVQREGVLTGIVPASHRYDPPQVSDIISRHHWKFGRDENL